MEQSNIHGAVRAHFNDSFNEDEAAAQIRSTSNEGISPQRTRSLAENTATQRDIAPTDTTARVPSEAEGIDKADPTSYGMRGR